MRSSLLLSIALSLFCLACAPTDPPVVVADPDWTPEAETGVSPPAQTNQSTDMADFEGSVMDLQSTFGGDGKQDLISRASVCELIEPVARYGDALIRGGFVLGLEGALVLGPIDTFGGYDLVWDLYSQQVTVSRYGGSITTLDEASISATAYVGFAAGFHGGVADWYGYHESVTVAVGLPFLDDFFSIDITGFRSAVDLNGDGTADASEVLAPPDGVFGYTVGLTAGIDAVPDPLPVELTLQEGYWEPHKPVIRSLYDRFHQAKVLGFNLPIAARLVDTADGSDCDEDWPLVDGERDCVIELGDPEKSRAKRALHVARSICTATKSCALPLTWSLAASALAVGKLRDMGLVPSELCPGIVHPAYVGRTFKSDE